MYTVRQQITFVVYAAEAYFCHFTSCYEVPLWSERSNIARRLAASTVFSTFRKSSCRRMINTLGYFFNSFGQFFAVAQSRYVSHCLSLITSHIHSTNPNSDTRTMQVNWVKLKHLMTVLPCQVVLVSDLNFPSFLLLVVENNGCSGWRFDVSYHSALSAISPRQQRKVVKGTSS